MGVATDLVWVLGWTPPDGGHNLCQTLIIRRLDVHEDGEPHLAECTTKVKVKSALYHSLQL